MELPLPKSSMYVVKLTRIGKNKDDLPNVGVIPSKKINGQRRGRPSSGGDLQLSPSMKPPTGK
jgi:hypothetical protein